MFFDGNGGLRAVVKQVFYSRPKDVPNGAEVVQPE